MSKKVIIVLLLLSLFSVTAREYTQPPGIALRNALAYIVEARLKSKTPADNQMWTLSFDKMNDLHNNYDSDLSFLVSTELAQSLKEELTYVLAFQTHRKTKIEGMVNYIPFEQGPTFIEVQGADPAVFIRNELLISQLKTEPELATTNPQQLIKQIMLGITSDDPKIQEFFIRELINWNGLPAVLNEKDLKVLAEVLNHAELNVGALTALLENRTEFHQALGLNQVLNKAIDQLRVIPVGLDDGAKIPTLVFTAMSLLKAHEAGDYELFKRWLGSNNPAIAEMALQQMQRLNPGATKNAVVKKLNHTMLNETSRRVLERYAKKHVTSLETDLATNNQSNH